jgi:hypothetical protein
MEVHTLHAAFRVKNQTMLTLKPVSKSRPILRAIAIAAATIMLTFVIAPSVVAQTITEPNNHIKSSPPPATAKSLSPRRAKSCSMYGAGFVYVPATDACVKLGGYMRMDGAINHGH